MTDLQLTHVAHRAAGTAVEHDDVDHQVAPAACRRAAEAILEAHHLDHALAVKRRQRLGNGRDTRHAGRDEHATHTVTDAIRATAADSRPQLRLLDDPRDLLEARHLAPVPVHVAEQQQLEPAARRRRHAARHLVERRLGERGVGQQRRGLGRLLALCRLALDGLALDGLAEHADRRAVPRDAWPLARLDDAVHAIVDASEVAVAVGDGGLAVLQRLRAEGRDPLEAFLRPGRQYLLVLWLAPLRLIVEVH